jgi:hypothetical protein
VAEALSALGDDVINVNKNDQHSPSEYMLVMHLCSKLPPEQRDGSNYYELD